jgi:flagellar protein FlaG
MALEPIASSSTVSSTVQTGKSTNSQSTQQDLNTDSSSSGVSQAQDAAVVYNSQQSNTNTLGKTDNNEQWIKNAVTDTNNKIKMSRTRCEFSYNDEINRVAIKVVDSETDEVIKEIPPEETLKVIEKIWEIAGLVVDERR